MLERPLLRVLIVIALIGGCQMEVDDAETTGWMCIARSDGVTLQSEVENELAMRIPIAMEGQPATEIQMRLEQLTRQTTER